MTVRVGSPGDNGDGRSGERRRRDRTTSVTPPATGQGTVDESAVAVATQDGATNTNVSIRVFSPGNDGAVSQTNTAVAAARHSGPDGATADGDPDRRPEHERLDPGRKRRHAGRGHPAEHGIGRHRLGAVSTTTTPTDSTPNLSVVVDGNGSNSPASNGLQVWEWTWNWDRDESAERDAAARPQPVVVELGLGSANADGALAR